MRYIPLSSSFYRSNRARFMDAISQGGLAVFNSNDIYPISADSTMPFQQHRDIFYLSGIDQEESVLLLFPDAKNSNHREVLFVKKTNNHIAIWEGAKLSQKEATNISGIQTVLWTDDFNSLFNQLTKEAKSIYFNTNEHYRANIETQTREDRFIEWAKKKYPTHQHEKSNFILQRLRSLKHKEEICQIQQAINITEKGFRRVLDFVKPGVWEYEIEAEFVNEFIKNRSKGFAYSPIIASGRNSNVLHYTQNNSKCQSGDLILIDVGAEYGNYASDMTRTIPVSGKFTPRQRRVYDAVRKIGEESMQLLVPGTLIKEYNQEVGKIMSSALIDLGLLDKKDLDIKDKKNPAYKKYYMHGTSHHLGLDTHDYGLIEEPIEPNMVLSVEPGIYIPEENFGIRIEEDVVVQEKGGPINLTKNIPKDPDEIEFLMSSR
ncbi:aminopeptidase P N-terminal domain-containing protein [Flavobacteriaceae bacterium]|nr:aminopeptidase P N-terminal domain-containing protein [Flavobacteriaceae bacterium]